MDIRSLSSVGQTLTPSGGLPDVTRATQSRALAQAVQQLNHSSVVPNDRELSMAIDPKTKLPVVRVLDSTTREVLEQLPTEDVLRVTAFLQTEAAQQSLSNSRATER